MVRVGEVFRHHLAQVLYFTSKRSKSQRSCLALRFIQLVKETEQFG